MMTPTEFEYLKRAMAALEEPPPIMTRAKIMRTMAQILNRAADGYEREFQLLVDQHMERNYQDIQNQKLLKVIQDA